MAWSTAVPDWRERIRAGRSLVPALPLFEERAAQGVRVFDRLRLPDVQGTPTNREAVGDWFRDIVRALFGSLDPVTRARMISEVFLLVPKKNSKTTGGAHVMLTALLVNERPNAEFYLLAPTQHITELAFDQVVGAIGLDRYLSDRLYVQTHKKLITDQKLGATLAVRSFAPESVTGVKPAGAMVDETHVVGAKADADRVLRQLRGGMVSQPEAFLFQITTQSERPPAGVFKAELERARSVRDGARVEALLAVLYEFPEEVARCIAGPDGLFPWEDPAVWPMVTPNNGRSITVDRLVPDYQKAKAESLEALRGWASQHLNIEIGMQLRADRWAGADFWPGATVEGLSLAEILARSDVVTVGIDGGGLDDLLSLALVGRDRVSKRWMAWGKSWAHAVVLDRRRSEEGRLRDFERDGDLMIVDQLGEDLADLVNVVAHIEASGKLASVGLDPAGVGAIVDALAEIGVSNVAETDATGTARVVGVGQGWQLQGSVKTVERKLADGTLVHGGQAIMAWAVGNAKTETRGNATLVTKAAAGTAKIDPLMALFDAAALMARNPSAEARSYLDAAELVVL